MKESSSSSQDMIMLFAQIYLFIKRYFIILILFILAGIFCGYYKNHSAGYFYKKHLAISSIVVPKDISLDIINSLQLLIDENNASGLSKKLNIPVNAAAALIKIDTVTYHNRQNIGFMVDLSFRDSTYADTITAGFISFLNNNAYIQKNIRLFMNEKERVLKSIDERLKIVDSTGEGNDPVYSSIQSKNTILVRSASSELVHLMEERYQAKKDIEFGSKISIVDDTLVKMNSGIGLTKSIILYVLGFGILGVLLSLLIESIRLTKKFLKEQKG